MIKIAEDSEKLLRTTVVQEVQKNEDTFSMYNRIVVFIHREIFTI